MATSHTQSVLSRLTETAVCQSGANAMAISQLACPQYTTSVHNRLQFRSDSAVRRCTIYAADRNIENFILAIGVLAELFRAPSANVIDVSQSECKKRKDTA